MRTLFEKHLGHAMPEFTSAVIGTTQVNSTAMPIPASTSDNPNPASGIANRRAGERYILKRTRVKFTEDVHCSTVPATPVPMATLGFNVV